MGKKKNNIWLVSDYASYNTFRHSIENIMTYERFKNKYLLQCPVEDIEKIDCFLFHLYYEEKEYSSECSLKKTIIRDPLHNSVSEIICGIIFNILNKKNDKYMKKLLGKIKFVSQNPYSTYTWGAEYFNNFDKCFINVVPSNEINLGTLDEKILSIKKLIIKNFVEKTYEAIKSAFTHHG